MTFLSWSQSLVPPVLGGKAVFCFHEGLWGPCRSRELIDPNLLVRQGLISAPGHRPVRSPLKTEVVARAGRASQHW